MIAFLRKFLFEHSGVKQIVIKNTFWLFMAEAVGRLLKMAFVIYAARVLGASGWGMFSYALSIGALLMILSDIGITNLISREAIQKKQGYATFISTALALKSILLVISTVVVLIAGPALSTVAGAETLFPLIAAILIFDALRDIGFALNRPSERMEREMTVKTLMNVATLALGFALFAVRPSPASVAIAYGAGSAVGFILIAYIMRKDIRAYLTRANWKLFGAVMRTTWPLTVITLVGSIMANTDIYMLGIWRDAAEIGLYSSVQRIQIFILIVPSMIATAVFPLLSGRATSDTSGFKTALEKTLGIVMVAGLPIALAGCLLAPQIVTLFFGAGFAGAVPMLRILMLMLIASFPLIVLSQAIFAHDKQRDLAFAYLFGVTVNVLLNFLLVPRFGAIGSAVATLFSTTLITAIIWRKMQRIQQFSVLPMLKRALIATITMLAVLFPLARTGTGAVVATILGGAVYFMTLYFLKEPLIKELRDVIKKR